MDTESILCLVLKIYMPTLPCFLPSREKTRGHGRINVHECVSNFTYISHLCGPVWIYFYCRLILIPDSANSFHLCKAEVPFPWPCADVLPCQATTADTSVCAWGMLALGLNGNLSVLLTFPRIPLQIFPSPLHRKPPGEVSVQRARVLFFGLVLCLW